MNVQSQTDRPDLAIYSQTEQLELGHAPTWDSPDITTNHWGPFRLLEEARIRVRNLSATAPAINALVHYSIAAFGIGTPRTVVSSQRVHVPASGEIELLFPLRQETLAGDPRVGVHIQIEHPHDPHPLNNAGSQVHDGSYTSESGRDQTLLIPVVNDSNLTREIQLSVLPTEVVATVSPTSQVLAPHQQIIATLQISVPGFLSGTPSAPVHRSVSVLGRTSEGEPIGGATKLLRIDD